MLGTGTISIFVRYLRVKIQGDFSRKFEKSRKDLLAHVMFVIISDFTPLSIRVSFVIDLNIAKQRHDNK